ncbi:MAG TPA: pyridoxamine 5'-phosphate oxidase family protein [Solirubrobacteraceae bacterium]|nr:pyridoxamine 5'-phosphate oxidase family protein [Solirubrobacteraceae bacterium]
MSRRAQIEMSPDEVAAFLAQERTVTCATIGRGGRPHLMPLWYALDGEAILCWTYASSQKAKNLERLAQATLQVEAGLSYEELRGVMMECDVELIREPERVREIGLAIALRYAPGQLTAETAPAGLHEFVARQATKRVGMRFTPTRTVSWDHRKLGGAY